MNSLTVQSITRPTGTLFREEGLIRNASPFFISLQRKEVTLRKARPYPLSHIPYPFYLPLHPRKICYNKYIKITSLQGGAQFPTGGQAHELRESAADLVKFQSRRYSPDERRVA